MSINVIAVVLLSAIFGGYFAVPIDAGEVIFTKLLDGKEIRIERTITPMPDIPTIRYSYVGTVIYPVTSKSVTFWSEKADSLPFTPEIPELFISAVFDVVFIGNDGIALCASVDRRVEIRFFLLQNEKWSLYKGPSLVKSQSETFPAVGAKLSIVQDTVVVKLDPSNDPEAKLVFSIPGNKGK